MSLNAAGLVVVVVVDVGRVPDHMFPLSAATPSDTDCQKGVSKQFERTIAIIQIKYV